MNFFTSMDVYYLIDNIKAIKKNIKDNKKYYLIVSKKNLFLAYLGIYVVYEKKNVAIDRQNKTA
ncbi:hypothetical protein [Snodgrassella alvi]|uniref:hypothetical protein n=1 Tax=Snodgrassella alvi TaxID=1196083 RepID=UPI00346147BA